MVFFEKKKNCLINYKFILDKKICFYQINYVTKKGFYKIIKDEEVNEETRFEGYTKLLHHYLVFDLEIKATYALVLKNIFKETKLNTKDKEIVSKHFYNFKKI